MTLPSSGNALNNTMPVPPPPRMPRKLTQSAVVMQRIHEFAKNNRASRSDERI
eukprot:GDKH01014803.1.p1 GENE.GDKH01014803.1~~GDKH01014803.1.p1  ORF type:complete len:53 (+),score=3.07 GDKH01014803.1:2-160(+)